MSKIEHFFEELEQLSKKYNLWIRGGSCCDMPELSGLMGNEIGKYTYHVDDDSYFASSINPQRKVKVERGL